MVMLDGACGVWISKWRVIVLYECSLQIDYIVLWMLNRERTVRFSNTVNVRVTLHPKNLHTAAYKTERNNKVLEISSSYLTVFYVLL